MRIKPLIGLACGAGIAVLLAFAAAVVHGGIIRPEFALTFVIGLLGTSLGWLAGLLASPYNDEELKRFAKYAGVVSTFLSGYVAGKLDPVIKRVLEHDPINIDTVTALRLAVFAT